MTTMSMFWDTILFLAITALALLGGFRIQRLAAACQHYEFGLKDVRARMSDLEAAQKAIESANILARIGALEGGNADVRLSILDTAIKALGERVGVTELAQHELRKDLGEMVEKAVGDLDQTMATITERLAAVEKIIKEHSDPRPDQTQGKIDGDGDDHR